MKEYGGYIELDTYRLPMLHDGFLALNCGRNCLAYVVKKRNIKKLVLPYLMCDSVFNICKKNNVKMSFYHIDSGFRVPDMVLGDDEWLYIMNYYGQLTADYLIQLKQKYTRVIVDNAQAYFDEPVISADTIYTCRKFFGVSDGAFLYTDLETDKDIEKDESYTRMGFLLGRFERGASEFYREYVLNNELFENEPIKLMSKLTNNLLHGIDYEFVKKCRTDNFNQFYDRFYGINKLVLHRIKGAFAYPLLVDNGSWVRNALQQKKIYIPTLWPNVLKKMPESSMEYWFSDNILPLPCDQRYDYTSIEYICDVVYKAIKG